MDKQEKQEQEFISNSPLLEANSESLDELFTRIDKKLILGLPQEITDSDISRVVAYYRKERERFIVDQSNFIKPGRKSKEDIRNIKEKFKNLSIEY